MLHINLYKAQGKLPDLIKGHYIRFEGLDIPKKSDRRALLQSIVTRLNKKGIDCAVTPADLLDNFHIAILGLSDNKVRDVISRYSNLGPRIIKTESVRTDTVERAWQNKIRTYLIRRGFLKSGDRYIFEKDVTQNKSIFKKAFRIQAVVINGYPSLFIDPCTRVMIPLSDETIDRADAAGEESKIKVRTLPNWSGGILIGKSGRKASDLEFKIGNRMYKTHDYWKIKHDIYFVKPDEEMLEVYLPLSEATWEYPRNCVFSEYKRGMALPEDLKIIPKVRVKLTHEFISTHLRDLQFLGQPISLTGPLSLSDVRYNAHNFPSENELRVMVAGHNITTIRGLHRALRKYGPYAGRIDGRYVAIHPGDKTLVSRAFKEIEKAYLRLNLGELKPLINVGDEGFIYTGGEYVSDYTSAIAELRSELENAREKVLVSIVLPDVHCSEVYFKTRDTLFERIFGAEPIPTQAISYEVLSEILKDEKRGYPICVNTASQIYVKLGGTGAAVWILQEAADTPIPGINPGSTCYAYHDVSRRPKKKASATAYSALTDSYGRYIATGTKPIGGEKLTPSGFYDILMKILQKVSMFSQRYADVGHTKKFKLKRLVFAKDGVIRDDEADMMEQVILKGIPIERKRPIPELLKKMDIFPNSLVIDIIDVNKSPNKRIFWRMPEGFANVHEGTAISYNESQGLIVSCPSRIGTAKPIEISFKKHLCLNDINVPKPSISQILEEYYRLTFLNWASIFRQGKYALPQILTQNLGENISAGVFVPDDMILL
jgi:hypothetical protein